jgi:outer membrane protein insertion porin family
MELGRASQVCAALCFLAITMSAAPLHADVVDFLGKPIASVRLEAEGRVITAKNVLGLLETRAGEPLAMQAVRASVTHLFSLGRFENVVVRARLVEARVALVYELTPTHPIYKISFAGTSGTAGVDDGRLRRAIAERYGVTPSVDFAPEMAGLVSAQLQARGYRQATVTFRVKLEHAPERGVLIFTVVPGPRTHVDQIDVSATSGVVPATLLRELGLSHGVAYEPDRLGERIGRFVDRLKRTGHYEARVSVSPRLDDANHQVSLSIVVQPGPRVRVQFRGDPLPGERREDLVPIAREGSADEDLLEDSAQRIVAFWQGQGYRDAKATFTREAEGDDLVITFTVTRGAQYRVAAVDVSGNEAITAAELAPVERVKEGAPFTSAALDAEVAAIQDLYARRGFAQTRAQATAQPSATVTSSQQVPMDVAIGITESARTVVGSVSIAGNHSIAAAELTAGLGLQPGRPFFPTQLAVDRDAVQLRYANGGFRNATVTSSPGLSADGTRADVVFTVQEGPRVFVDHVLIVGNDRTSAETIKRELQFKSGDPLGLEAIAESQRRLATLGLFRRARITELGHGIETTRDVVVTVEEAAATTIGYGGGLEASSRIRQTDADGGIATEQIEVAPRAFFEIGRRNLFGKNRSVNLFTRISLRPKDSPFFADQRPGSQTGSGYGFSEYRVLTTYREPRVFGTAADAFLTGTLEQQIRSSFNFARRALSAELLRRVTRHVSINGNYQIQRTELFDEKIAPADKLLIDRLFPQVRLSSFSLSAVRDGRNDLLDPSAGVYLSANGQIAARDIGSEVGFLKTYLTAQFFKTVPKTRRMVLATSARVGLAAGLPREIPRLDPQGHPVLDDNGQPIIDAIRDLPASERFFAGGDTTVRGFALDQLGTPATIDQDGFPIGGNALVILNAELRIPVRGGLGAVGFIDAGNVFAKTSAIDLGAFRNAVGFGIRYRSPVGPIRVDIGFKLDRRDIVPGRLEDRTALHISLGQAF